MTMDVFEDRDLYEIEIVRIESRTYKIRVRAYDEESAREEALLQYDPNKPKDVELIEEYAERTECLGP